MTYYGGKEMAAAYRTVRNNTIQIAREIPEEHYGFRMTPESFSVARMLAHMAFGPTFQLEVHGNRIDDLAKVDFASIIRRTRADEERPRTKSETLEVLRIEAERFATFLEGLSDAFLAERVRMPAGADPASKSRFEMLLSPKEHEMHHRAQLMVAQRMLGLVPHFTRQAQERMARAAART